MPEGGQPYNIDMAPIDELLDLLEERRGARGQGQQFDLSRLLSQPQFGDMLGLPVATSGQMLPSAEGQTFGPNVPFWGGSLFKPDERALVIRNAAALATNLSRAFANLRRKREQAKAKESDNVGGIRG